MMRALAVAGGALAFSVLPLASAAAAPGDLDPFGIAGSLAQGLHPGSSDVIDLTLTNPNDIPLTLQELTVSLRSIVPAVGVTGACTAADFALVQLTAAAGDVVLPPNSVSTLSDLGVATTDLPGFGMIDAPYAQDGCKGATVTLLFEGTALADQEIGGVDRPPVEVPGSGGSGLDPTGPEPTGPGEVGGVALPGTGANGADGLAGIGAGLVLVGAATVVALRRRRPSD